VLLSTLVGNSSCSIPFCTSFSAAAVTGKEQVKINTAQV
jgi:hypothetical protein